MDPKKAEEGMGMMGVSFIMTLARLSGIKPKDFADAIVEDKKDQEYLEEFTLEFSRATIEAMKQKRKDRDAAKQS